MRLVLASASPARRAVLRAAGIEPVVVVSGVDEDAVAAALADPTPHDVVTALACAKAHAVLDQVGTELDQAECVVVGCDSMLLFDGELTGKPGTVEVARQRWRRMAGGIGELLTGHAVLRVRGTTVTALATGSERTTIHFGQISDDELTAYLDTGEPLQVAGAFTLDGLGGWFVDGIEGDPSSVVGISLPLTRRLLREVGVSAVDLWTVSRDSEPATRQPG